MAELYLRRSKRSKTSSAVSRFMETTPQSSMIQSFAERRRLNNTSSAFFILATSMS